MSERAVGTARGPVRDRERALAPDLARGAMLLLIALANFAVAVFGAEPGVDPHPHGLERAYSVGMFALVNARAYPMFAIMFGYGLVQLARRQEAAGASPRAARAVLLRRNGWLLAFGLVHGALLNFGDFLGAYGLVGIVFTLVLLRRGEKVQRLSVWYWGLSVVYTAVLAVLFVRSLGGGPGGHAGAPTTPVASLRAHSYGASVLDRLGEWPVHTLTVLPFILMVWIGAWAARRRILEEPERHRRMLRWTAAVALPLAIAGGLPMGLLAGGYLHLNGDAAHWALQLYQVSGQFGGLGYVAVFGLVAAALTRRRADPRAGLAVGSLTALGRCSLSGYLLQSVAWVAVASPYLLDLGHRAGSPTFAAAGCALATWAATALGAYALQRRGKPAPAERLLRRLAYGARG